MIETHLLRYALAAADAGSFSRAANQFGIKQSTLSKHILYLEDRLGQRLFRRSTRGVIPTNSGEGFLRQARRIVDDIEALDAERSELALRASDSFRFGFQGSLHRGDLSAIFREFSDACPDVEIAGRECSRAHLLRALEHDQLDVAVFAGSCDRPELVSMSLWYEPVTLCIAPGPSLADHDRLYWTDLRRRRFFVTADDPGPDLQDLILSRLSGSGHRPAIVVQHVCRENLLAFVRADNVAVLTGAATSSGTGRYIACPVHDAFGPTCVEYRAHWHRNNESRPLRRFLDILARRLAPELQH